MLLSTMCSSLCWRSWPLLPSFLQLEAQVCKNIWLKRVVGVPSSPALHLGLGLPPLNSEMALSSRIARNFSGLFLHCFPWAAAFIVLRIQVVLIPPNAEFHKARKTFQGLKPAREWMKNICGRNCVLMSTICFSIECSKKQIPNAHSAKSALRTVEKTAVSDMVHEWGALLFQKFQIKLIHSKRHTLTVRMCWIGCIFKFTTSGTGRHLILPFPPCVLIMTKPVLAYLVKVLLASVEVGFCKTWRLCRRNMILSSFVNHLVHYLNT